MTNKGVDISTIQGNVDFPSLKASGLDFVVLRCGVGNGGIDANYTKNIAGANAAGLKVMAYHFIYPLPPTANGTQPLRDPIKQAQYHFNAVQGQLAAIDCEWPVPQDWQKWNCSAAQINQWMKTYMDEYVRLDNGRKPLIYTYPYWAQALQLDPYFAQYGLWIASYVNAPNPVIPHPWTDWVMWQYGSGGAYKLPNGVPVDVDMVKDLSLWDPQQPAVPPAPPIDTSGLPANPPQVNTISPPAQPDPVGGVFNSIWNSISSLIKK